MKKTFFCVSLVLAGLMSSCVDKYEEVDAESKPSWLGSSIYAELANPGAESGLQGTFLNYLQLINDLGEAETLSRTGSKTVFPANDAAFARFFENNDWGVSSYADLSLGQKKLLLYSSMLDNPLLLQLLPNVSNGKVEPMNGQALKHETNVSVIDTVQHINGSGSPQVRPEGIPANNPYWESFYADGIDLVSDATRPMMIHLTREYMINNGISVTGSGSDFEVLTGSQFPESGKTAYIFNNNVIVPDVTCQNGYIHQVDNVVVPPGNMGQVLRRKDNTTLFSRVLDYFAVPVAVPTVTDNYNVWARSQLPPLPDKTVYALRYLSTRSFDSEANTARDLARINGNAISNVLNFDPGWNQYYPKPANENNSIDYGITDMGAVFVPSDQAFIDYFTQRSEMDKGPGAYLFDIYGNWKGNENTAAHIQENLDSLHSKNPQVLTAFVNNCLKASFAASVPSKFESVLNDAAENMGLTLGVLETKDDGKYDISFANNAAIYVLKELIAPDEYNAVLAPASVYPDMHVMNWAVQDRGTSTEAPYHLDADYKFYLLSMSSNYAFFIPDDKAFDLYYLDPATLGHRENNLTNGRLQPDVLHFTYDSLKRTEPKLICQRIKFDLETGELVGEPTDESIANVRTQLVDILNYHTVVLPSDLQNGKKVTIGYNGNHYYKTKHGGEIYVDGHQLQGSVKSGAQITNSTIFPSPKITQIYEEKNGNAYRLDRVIQPPHTSVFGVVGDTVNYPQFKEFRSLCMEFNNSTLLDWAGISSQRKEQPGKKEDEEATGPCDQDAYVIFTPDYRLGFDVTKEACLDYNVSFFNTYNYTLFAPDNQAMQQAYNAGLPSWDDVIALYLKYDDVDEADVDQAALRRDKNTAFNMINAIRDFVRYHFVIGSVYVDNVIDLNSPRVKTFTADEMGVAKELNVSGGNNVLVVRDAAQNEVRIDGGNSSKVVNFMARDYWFNARRNTASNIVTSSFCAVHQISEPLCGNSNGQFSSRAKSRKR